MKPTAYTSVAHLIQTNEPLTTAATMAKLRTTTSRPRRLLSAVTASVNHQHLTVTVRPSRRPENACSPPSASHPT